MINSSRKFDIYWAVIGLRDVGTEKCVPFLKELKDFPMQDVKDCLLLTIAHISGSKETEFYVSSLEQKGTRKDYVMWAIKDCADRRAIEPVIIYLNSVYKKWRQPKCTYAGDAYVDGLIFLGRYLNDDNQIKDVFDRFLSIANKIPSGSKERLKKEVSYFKINLTE